jgi:hypothetical protein
MTRTLAELEQVAQRSNQAFDKLLGGNASVFEPWELPPLHPPRKRRKPRVTPADGLRTPAEAAARLGCSIRTLNKHVAAGELAYVTLGQGTKRPRRMFTDADISAFIAARTSKDVPCPSTSPTGRHTSSMTSGSAVIAFTARPNARASGKPRK